MLLLALSSGTFAQVITRTVRGRVTDSYGKSGLPGANIVLMDSNPLIGTTTDLDGNFTLEKVPVGRHSFKVSYIGFKPSVKPEILVSSGKEVNLTFNLEEDAIQAGEVEIRAKVDKDKPINTMAMVSARSLTVEESRRYAGSADDPLRAVSGFAGVATGGDVASNEIIVRGNSPKGLLWRIDGIDIPNPNHFAYVGNSGGAVTMLSSQVLGNSDFFTAAFPGQYGNALSGVFDMRFRNGNDHRHEFAMQVGIQGLDLSAEGPFSKNGGATYLFNYRYSILAFMQLIDPEMKNKMPQYQDLSFKINIPTRKAGTFSLVGIGGISRSSATAIQDTAQWKTLDDRTESMLNNNMGAVGLIHQVGLNRRTMLRSSLSATYSDVRSEFSLMSPEYQPEPVNQTDHTLYGITAAIETSTQFSAAHSNKTGFSYARMFYDIDIKSVNPFTGVYGQVDKGHGNTDLIQAFSESKLDLTRKIRVGVGLHFQYMLLNRHYSLEPRLGFRWQFAPRHAISIGYGKHSQSEDVGVYLAKKEISPEFHVLPNQDLDFSRAHHFVMGYDFLIRSDMRFKAEAYYQYLYHIPVIPGQYVSLINSDGGYTNDSLTGSGTGKNFGIDLTFEKFLTHQVYYLVTISLFDSKYKGGDGVERNTRYNSNFVVNLLGGKEWTVRKNNLLGVNLKASFTGGSYYVPVDLEKSIAAHQEVLDGSNAYRSRYPGFYYLDLTVTYRTNHKKFSGIWAVQIKNLLDQKPQIGQVYNDFNKTIEPVRSMGLLPFLSYKVEF